MTMAVPMQEFQIGQRVRVRGQKPFVIRSMFLGLDEVLRYGSNNEYDCFEASELTLAPERPPYVPSERRVIGHHKDYASQNYINRIYRCETDTELAARHELEQIAHELEALP